MENEMVKVVVYTPASHANIIREALGAVGAGKVGDYEYCSFSIKGIGRFKPMPGAHPAIGQIGKMEEVAEEQIGTVCLKKDLEKIIKAVKAVHPYEEMAFDAYPLLNI